MRLSALVLPVLLCLGACASSEESQSPFNAPNELMGQEIQSRIDQIPFQHREELLQNLLWLSQTGEPAIPALLNGLKHNEAKVRSSCAWVLGRMRDRRVIPELKMISRDQDETVRLEVARSLVVMGDLSQAPALIEGLDSQRKEVRFLCHEALKSATGRDFGFDHLNPSIGERQVATFGWRQWWSDYSGDAFFASAYAQEKGIDPENPQGVTGDVPAAPMGETMQTVPPGGGAVEMQGQEGTGTVPPVDLPVTPPTTVGEPDTGNEVTTQPVPPTTTPPSTTPSTTTPVTTPPTSGTAEDPSKPNGGSKKG